MKKEKKRTKKLGLPPGTVVYTGNKTEEKVSINYYTYNNINVEKFKIEDLDTFEKINHDKDKTNWLNIDGVHDIGVVEKIGAKYNIDNFILEDIVSINQRPKVEEREDYIYIVVRMMRYNKQEKKIISEQLSLILSEEYLITFQEEKGDVFDPIRKRIESGGKICKKNNDYLAYAILDSVVDNYFLVLDYIELEIDELEERIIHTAVKADLEKIIALKQEFNIIKRAMLPIREIMKRLQHDRGIEIFKDDMTMCLNDIQDHAIIIHDTVENMSNRVTSLLDIYHSTVNSTMNDIMKLLTIVSTIFVPLTFLAGIYGMNFENLPGLSWKDGYYALLLVMVVLTVFMLYFFRKKKWL
ncbi:MAG: magnesium/cobalt transporter CorA [Fusobacteriaceae bacterium]